MRPGGHVLRLAFSPAAGASSIWRRGDEAYELFSAPSGRRIAASASERAAALDADLDYQVASDSAHVVYSAPRKRRA
jgi:hypothetical protein